MKLLLPLFSAAVMANVYHVAKKLIFQMLAK
jgi:hypothetical protein